MKIILFTIVFALFIMVGSCSSSSGDVEKVTHTFIAYLAKYASNEGGLSKIQPVDFKYSEVVNGECEVIVKAGIMDGSKTEYGSILVKLKKYNGEWCVYEFAIISPTDTEIDYIRIEPLNRTTLERMVTVRNSK